MTKAWPSLQRGEVAIEHQLEMCLFILSFLPHLYPGWVLGQNESCPAQLEHSADLISCYVTGNTSCNKFILFYIYVVIHHCSTLLMGKQIMNNMTNNKQGYLFLALKEINQTEVAFPALPSTPKSICSFQNSTSSPKIKTNYTNITENFHIFQYLCRECRVCPNASFIIHQDTSVAGNTRRAPPSGFESLLPPFRTPHIVVD